MKTDKIEGIILNKYPLKGRNLSVDLLLRNGQKANVIFYGGIGGGKKGKGGVIEFGQMLEVITKDKKNKNKDFFEAKEWNLTWYSDQIRMNHHAFYLMCFFLEISALVATQYSDNEYQENSGLFALLSNSLYFLDKSLEQQVYRSDFFLIIFFSRLLQEAGILPNMSGCIFCGDANIDKLGILNFEHGGFSCSNCAGDHSSSEDDSILVSIFRYTQNNIKSLFEELQNDKFPFMQLDAPIKKIFNFFLYQFHLEQDKIKSATFIL